MNRKGPTSLICTATRGIYAYLYNESIVTFLLAMLSPDPRNDRRQNANPSQKAFNMQSRVKLPLPPSLACQRSQKPKVVPSVVLHGDSCVLISHKLRHQLNFVMRGGDPTSCRLLGCWSNVPSVSFEVVRWPICAVSSAIPPLERRIQL